MRVRLEFTYDNLKKDMSELIAVLVYTTSIFIAGVIFMFIYYTLKDIVFRKKIT